MRKYSKKSSQGPNLYVLFCIARITAVISVALMATGLMSMIEGSDNRLSCVLLAIGGLLLLPIVIGCINAINRLGAGVTWFLYSLEQGDSEDINEGLEFMCHMVGIWRRTHITRPDH